MTITAACGLPPIAIELDASRMFPSMAQRCWEGSEQMPVNPYLQALFRILLLGDYPEGHEDGVHALVCRGRRWLELDTNEVDGSITWAAGEYRCVDLPKREVLLLALGARNAAIEGRDTVVDDFARNVLGIAQPEQSRDGVIDALLGDWVHQLGRYLTDPELLRILNEYTAVERRRWQPLWERKVKGKRIGLTGATIGDGLTAEGVLPDRRTPEGLALHYQFGDERVRRVLRWLHPDEAAVAARWAQDAGTWAESARGVGLPASYGERVRKKLHRLAAEQKRRSIQRSAAPAGTLLQQTEQEGRAS
ncbi:hypothetical protein ACSNOH_09720 [Streptomyces sp. URMC 127]|uniref:hypothetical protein n=1 Tax=Streptomyces sp. URMC 127 TaxID=3423402 RepID=UPI003F1D680A